MSLEDARKKWIVEQPQYEAFSLAIADVLRSLLRPVGIWFDVSDRSKAIDSLIRKLLKRPDLTYEALNDKAGARVIVRYLDEVDEVLRTIQPHLQCSKPEYKIEALGTRRLGYLSVHQQVRFPETAAQASLYHPNRFVAELQVRTLAQHLWAEMSHDAFYKNDATLRVIPPPHERRINLLAGLIEVADMEFNRLNNELPPVPEIQLLHELERHYFKLTSRRGDSELSLEVIRMLQPLYVGADVVSIAEQLKSFFKAKKDVLEHAYSTAAEDGPRTPFLYQPEILMIYDRLVDDEFATRKAWNVRFPDQELERIALTFGISFD